jgi:hypothetical protein
MSILNDRNYEDGILCDAYGHILIVTVTEYGAKKSHGKILGQKRGCTPLSPPCQGYTPCDWPKRIGASLSDIVNYRHNCLEISVFTKLHEILEYDGSYIP